MVLRVAIVGPGRVGRAIGNRLAAAGVSVEGFVGRARERAAAACDFVPGSSVLGWSDLRAVHCVLFAVGDEALTDAVGAASPHARPCSLWLHTSGRFGPEVFASVSGIRRGVLHPAMPIPDAATGAATMAGAPAVLAGEPSAKHLLVLLAAKLAMVPVWRDGGSSVQYHAACVLAANAVTALLDAAERTFVTAGGLAAGDARRVAAALARAAVQACAALGPSAALSGPVRRGDAATVAAHLAALAATDAPTAELYRATMSAAVRTARAAGLDEAGAASVDQVLRRGEG